MSDIIKFDTINFEKIEHIIGEYIKIEFIIPFRYPYNYINFLTQGNNEISICYIYDKVDNLKMKDITMNEFDIDDIYNSDNQYFEVINTDNSCYMNYYPSYAYQKYILISNLKNNTNLKNKIFSNDYKLFIFFEKNIFIVKLIYSPNMRKYKLQQIQKKIDDVYRGPSYI